MRILEFYDKTAIENIASTLLCKPDEVVFLGVSRKHMERSIEDYAAVAKKRGLSVRFSARGINRNDLQAAVDTLTALVQETDNCFIDLCGGEDLLLTAAGIVFEQYPQKVQLHRFNVYTGTITDCDADGVVCGEGTAALDVEDIIRICGGRAKGLHAWHFTEEFDRDLTTLWELCRTDPSRWNMQLGMLGGMTEGEEGSLQAVIPRPRGGRDTEKQRARFDRLLPLLQTLSDKGLLCDLRVRDDGVSFAYKNEPIKDCLSKAGQVLELVITRAARRLSDEDGAPLYHDVQCGVTIDWDGETAPLGDAEVANEIDVLLTKGLVPVFISCKNGQVDTDELYKLSAVAERFGGKYAKKVLVATELETLGSRAEYLRARCREMGIRLLEDVDRMSENELERVLRSLWKN